MRLTAILIDDERPALKLMSILLSRYPQIEITGQFLSPLKALEEIPRLRPKVVFLDVDMPNMSGMEAASRILELSPLTKIVFVTAYEKYALEAYQFHPMDYILKPVDEDRLEKLVEYILQSFQSNAEVKDKKLMIRCFGNFCVQWEDREPVKWRTEKTKEILAYLLDNYDRKIEKEEILESLWPEEDPDRAMKQLYNGVYYIRKTLAEYGACSHIAIDKSYNLELSGVDFDVQQLKALKSGDISELECMDRLIGRMYFDKQDYLWAQEKREEYFLMHQKCLMKLSAWYQEHMQYEQAEKQLLKAMKNDPLSEAAAERLLHLYLLTGNKAKGIRAYLAYEKLIRAELGEAPSISLADCYHKLKNS